MRTAKSGLMQFPVPPAPSGRHPEGPTRGGRSPRQLPPAAPGALPGIGGMLRRAAASADGTGSRALACARLHGSCRAARAAHTGTRMRVAMAHSHQRFRAGVAFAPCQQGRAAPWT